MPTFDDPAFTSLAKPLNEAPVAIVTSAALHRVDQARRAVEAWFHEETEAGRTILAARAAIQEQEAPFPFWFCMTPGHR